MVVKRGQIVAVAIAYDLMAFRLLRRVNDESNRQSSIQIRSNGQSDVSKTAAARIHPIGIVEDILDYSSLQ